jgi:hypothetical protein
MPCQQQQEERLHPRTFFLFIWAKCAETHHRPSHLLEHRVLALYMNVRCKMCIRIKCEKWRALNFKILLILSVERQIVTACQVGIEFEVRCVRLRASPSSASATGLRRCVGITELPGSLHLTVTLYIRVGSIVVLWNLPVSEL